MNFITLSALLKDVAGLIGVGTVLFGFVYKTSKSVQAFVTRLIREKSGYQENWDRDNTFKEEYAAMKTFFVQKLDEVQQDLLEMNHKLNRTEDLEKKQLRKIVTDIYTQYSAEKSLPYYVHRELVEMYTKYKNEYSGNSYADELFHIMQDWDIQTLPPLY